MLQNYAHPMVINILYTLPFFCISYPTQGYTEPEAYPKGFNAQGGWNTGWGCQPIAEYWEVNQQTRRVLGVEMETLKHKEDTQVEHANQYATLRVNVATNKWQKIPVINDHSKAG